MEDTRFKEYVDRYCRHYGYSPEQAKDHAVVKAVKESYERDQPVSRTYKPAYVNDEDKAC